MCNKTIIQVNNMSKYQLSEDLAVWFGKKKKKKGSSQPKGPWVNICKKKEGGGHPPCGRKDADEGSYPVCRAAGVAGKMSQSEKDSACRRKREKEKKDPQTGKGQKPTRIKIKNYKKESVDTKLIQNILSEFIETKTTISDEIQYHIDNNISISEGLFRRGSNKYFEIINEARKLREKGFYVNEEDDELLDSDLGEFFIYKGERLPLDFPFEYKPNINEQGVNTFWEDDDDRITLQDILKLTKKIQVINLPTKKLTNIVLNWDNNPEEIERISQVEISSQYPILIMVDEKGKIQWILDGNHRVQKALRSKLETIPVKLIKPSDLNPKAKKIFGLTESEDKNKTNVYSALIGFIILVSEYGGSYKSINEMGGLVELREYYENLRDNRTPKILSNVGKSAQNAIDIEFRKWLEKNPNKIQELINMGSKIKSKNLTSLSEAEYKGKDVELNKPKSGGSKKWYVYVRNPKTGKVKKVSYGSPVMTAKWNDPEARKSFAARHQCEKKKDKTKAGYWACRAHKDFGKNVPGRFW
jgi:hypothetical protein